ncbi:MAG: MazG [Candidatus Saccharibacteria bacterium]|jgi:NTP pyrophosphatase (non-canonical NTP hydrolase)|nr:MazG [Candidatus Saccharibacteria bacterium]
MAFAEAQKEVDDWAQTLAEPYWPPLSQFTRLAEEVGEVGRELNARFGSKPKKTTDSSEDMLGEELADAIFAIVCIANAQKIDLDQAFQQVMQKCYGRDKDRFAKKAA